MKTLSQPRSVLVIADEARLAAMRGALADLGIEGYQASSLDSAVQRAQRADTLLVLFDADGLETSALIGALAAIRGDKHSREVLLAVVAAERDADALYAAGANVVQAPPLTPSVAYTTLLRLARRARSEAMGPPQGDDPHEFLKKRVTERLARLKIFLGAAPGVGKTYAMLLEAREVEDAVVGLVETHNRQETAALLANLEVMPRRELEYKGTKLEELDLDAILQRRPALALVDELAHTNVPGSVNKKRYEDVNVLRLAGIPVVSTLNIQHIESLNTIVERITGVKVRETVPDGVLEDAQEVVLVDLPPETLQKRLAAGKIYAPDKVSQSLANFFTTHNLTALRELALRELADRVDEHLEEVRANIGRAEQNTGIHDRVLICVTPTVKAERLIRRGARLAGRLNADLLVVHVETRPLSTEEDQILRRHFELADGFDAEIIRLRHPEVATALARFAQTNHITIIVLGETRKPRWQVLFQRTVFETILDLTDDVDIVTVATNDEV